MGAAQSNTVPKAVPNAPSPVANAPRVNNTGSRKPYNLLGQAYNAVVPKGNAPAPAPPANARNTRMNAPPPANVRSMNAPAPMNNRSMNAPAPSQPNNTTVGGRRSKRKANKRNTKKAKKGTNRR